jgi:signal recognition particle subunit SRP54
MIRQMSTGKGKWAQLARQYGMGAGGGAGLEAGMPGMPGLPRPGGGSGKKTGKAARKEKRKQKQKARSGRR